MQIIALYRPLPICSRQSSNVVCGSARFTRPSLTSRVASRTYRGSRKEDSENLTASNHPLSVQNLRALSPDVPHTFFSLSKSPYFNLAVEHHLLTYSPPSSRILFTYTNSPCVIIGRNQNPWTECNIGAITEGTPDGRPVDFIRRRSGGGAVFHDEGNLNYTVIVPAEGFERKTHVQMVVDAVLMQRGKNDVPRLWEDVKANDRNDIVACPRPKEGDGALGDEWFKVSGTAFKLTRGRALHHGTLLHSSPNIDSIGAFLRSPGKGYITAKGVESVRSPVMNLWKVSVLAQRRFLAFALKKTIEKVWAVKYTGESSTAPKPIEIKDGQAEQLIPELTAGIDELRTPGWKWFQTPSYSFDSKEIMVGGQILRLIFEVKNGLIQSVQTSEELQATYEQLLVGQSIEDLSAPDQWRRLLMTGKKMAFPKTALIQILETCFPPLHKKYEGNIPPNEPEAAIVEGQGQDDHVLLSKTKIVRQDGRLPRDEYRMRKKVITAADRLQQSLAEASILQRQVSNAGKRMSQPGKMVERMGSLGTHVALDDLSTTTADLSFEMVKFQRMILKLLKPSRTRALRKANVKFTPMFRKLELIAKETREQAVRLAKLLTGIILRERKKDPRRSLTLRLDDPDDWVMGMERNTRGDGGIKAERDGERETGSSSESSSAQRVLEATLAMIRQEDQWGQR